MPYHYICSINGRILADKILLADDLWSRTKGLLGQKTLGAGDGLWISPCRQIHTFFMRFPIDVIFMDHKHKVMAALFNLPPWRISPFYISAGSVLEFQGGSMEQSIKKGDFLKLSMARGSEHAS